MQTILLVEDDYSIRQSIKSGLEEEGYKIIEAEDGEEAITLFSQNEIHLVLLDIMLPKLRGEAVLKTIRQTSEVPVLIISALNDELIQVETFKNRVDDYVVKPFSLNILSYKIKSLLRRVYGEEAGKVVYKHLTLIPKNYEAYLAGEPLQLSAKDFDILQVMLSNQGRVYEREELITLVWGYEYYGDIRNIDVHIKNIRKKTWSDLIRTVKGVGYKIEKA
ncbi:response regulator transcription factor [Candidatus Enterococcus huntleyi]|uniref:response regulator transcription factor n=1 Tax=Candidatus Enterococcus huntleyi TaxID=1857217 RepID=UPI0013795FF6|nr:response regulator transcription factor [Enterococcus sp. JM4C]